MALIRWGSINAAGDITMATIVRTPGTQTRTAIRELIELLTPGIIASDPTVTAAAEAAVAAAINEYFQPGSQAGLVTFPNNSEPGTAFGMRYAINPASIPAGTENFHGLALTSGLGTITVRSTGGVGKWGNSLTPGYQRATAGDAIVTAEAVVGAGDGVSRIRVAGVTGGSAAKTMGGLVAARFESNDFKYFRWTIGSAGNYAIQRWTGTNFTSGTMSTLVSSGVLAKSGDLVDFVFNRRDGIVSLAVNGAIAATAQVSTAIRNAHATADRAGMWMIPTIPMSNFLGGWQWLAEYTSGTINRELVSVRADGLLPSSVFLSPAQKRQAVGNVFNIKDYGAKMDAIYLTDARTSAGTDYVWSDSRDFTSADIGKRLAVMGPGAVLPNANDGVLMGTILSIDGAAARIGTVATATMTGRRCVFGTTDDLAFAMAQKDAVRAGGGTVFIPAGRCIVTQSLYVENFVSWAGENRDTSWVHVIMDNLGPNTAAGTADWLTCAGRDATNLLRGAHFRDFGINAEAMIHSSGYGAGIKPLNIYFVQRCSIKYMNVWNTPATAVPFDHSYDHCEIAHNVIMNPGRLAPSGIGPGGSGIGAGTRPLGAVEPTLIHDNIIIGGHAQSVAGAGHNGIFTEAQTGSDPDAGVVGYRIVNNVVIGMPYGISDTGSTGTIIEGNQIVGCGTGIRLAATTLPDSYAGLHAIVSHNVIRGSQGPGASDGTGIQIFTQGARPNFRSSVHTLVESNQIFEGSGWGIRVSADGAGDVDLDGIVLRGNIIRENGRSGIMLRSSGAWKIRYLQLRDNQLVSNGTRGIVGDSAAVFVESGTTLEGGRIQDNDIYDLAAVPTQVDGIVTTGATLTGVRRSGNTGDA